MSRFKTVYGVYFINDERTIGYSHFFNSEFLARETLRQMNDGWQGRLTEQTYELEEDSHHDCGDDE